MTAQAKASTSYFIQWKDHIKLPITTIYSPTTHIGGEQIIKQVEGILVSWPKDTANSRKCIKSESSTFLLSNNPIHHVHDILSYCCSVFLRLIQPRHMIILFFFWVNPLKICQQCRNCIDLIYNNIPYQGSPYCRRGEWVHEDEAHWRGGSRKAALQI